MRAVVIGEAMLEYRTRTREGELCYGGDTLNTSVHLARLGLSVRYVSALGSDGLSDRLCQAWNHEGVDTRHVLRHPSRQPGIYAIENDAFGERSFLYWREHSAAREMFSLPGIDAALADAAEAELLYFSLITLAILPEPARATLLEVARERLRHGLAVAYDGNFRQRLWPSLDIARSWSEQACTAASIGLPTLSDEISLWSRETDAKALGEAWLQRGCTELAVKTGADGCTLVSAAATTDLPPARSVEVVDSSGAGDAFNAGYLAARMRGLRPESAARCGQILAEWVIQRPGAVPQQDPQAPYAELTQRLAQPDS